MSETEREELTGMMCQFLKENMSSEVLNKYCHGKTFENKTYLDYAKDSGNEAVIAQIYELAKGKKQEKHLFSLNSLYPFSQKKAPLKPLTSRVLRDNKITAEERNQER